MAQDRIFFSAVLGSFSGVVVSIGGDARTAAWSVVPDDDIGAYHGSQHIDGRTGPVTVSLMRNNVVITTIQGESISSGCPNGIQNWNAWVGSATGDKVSTSPKQELSDQSYKNGTSAHNFAGLCEFSCKYNYYPLGACTCTKMGLGYKKPNSTGVVGYPIPGEGASYSGLCNFDCNLGYCPPSSCGTEEVPLIVPTVSPFLPPACTSGTGEGNLAGLCDFSCTHGFCPMNACTCTGQGAVNVMAPTTDKTGTAAPGNDVTIYGPMCEYTCQRGYCPEGVCVEQDSSESGSNSGSGSGSGSGDVYIAPSIWDDPSPVVECQPPCSIILPPLPLDSPSTLKVPEWTTPITQSYLTTRTSTDAEGITTTYRGYKKTTLTTTTLTPPPYPWTQTTKDTQINRGTTTITWSSGSPTPTVSKGSKGSGHGCAPWCGCLGCPPSFDSISGGGGSSGGTGSGSGSDGDNEDECSTETAQVCSTVCIKGSDCDIDCSTTTGCSVTPSSTKIVGTPAPGYGITMESWPTTTEDPAEVLSSAISQESVLSSMFGSLSVLEGLTTTATGPAPTSGSSAGRIELFYYHTNVDSEAQWEIYEGIASGKGCPGRFPPDFVKKDGSYNGIHNGDSGFKAYGKSCKYEGTNLPIGKPGVKVASLCVMDIGMLLVILAMATREHANRATWKCTLSCIVNGRVRKRVKVV
ncbi:hypothetical protein N7497_003681 [Penicillium chrysogenum]|nr:hypothetical protein N7497_003681 [Penicillium chrysogenum]